MQFLASNPYFWVLAFCFGQLQGDLLNDNDLVIVPIRDELSRLSCVSYNGVVEGWTSDSVGFLRTHRRSFFGRKNARRLEIRHDDQGSDTNHTTTIVSNGLYSFYNHFNCVLIESRRFSNLETNPKLEGSFLEFYSVAIGWFPELDRHSGFVAENQWPLFADTFSTHNTFRHGEIDGIQADQYVYYSKTCTTEIFFQQGVRRSFPVKTIQTFVGREFNKVVFTFSDFRTVDGISFKLPFKVVREVFLTGSITASAYTKYQLSEFNVLSSEGNPFRLMDEPGRVTIDLDSGTQIACPGGQALMSKVCNHCKAHFGARFLRRGQSIETCVFIGLFSCAIAVCWLFSRPRQE